ncbi:MAG TPA: S8 family peptidase [Acidiferrobacteraceae bacterium]|nr:S8 family peptidase [Acidiferrobacteraceae bacterium]
MDENHPHLRILREEPINERRSKPPPRFKVPDDPSAHAHKLQGFLQKAQEHADEDIGGFDERRLFRFEVQPGFNPDDIRRLAPGIDLISQEEKTIILAFASEAAVEEFEARLSTLAEGGKPTNRNFIYALQGVDSWTAADRRGWALKQEGLPETETFVLDVELWPLATQAERSRLRNAFEDWSQQYEIEQLDSVNQPGLLLYRVRTNQEQAEQLLHYRDVRTVDLPPRYSLDMDMLGTDIADLPPIPEPPENAQSITILDSGVATGHPLLGLAIGEAQSFLPGMPDADGTGHGTHIAGLALYGDVEETLRTGAFVPQFRLFSGRILDDDDANETGFVENHINKAVRYFNREYGCRIFNLSFGDLRKPYRQGHVRGLAVTLDTLSRELSVVFVVSAGNVLRTQQDGQDWRNEYPDYLTNEDWSLVDPATALNVLTVGSLARWDRDFSSQRYPDDPAEVPIALRDQPSPFTRRGPSLAGAIKPELVAYGGNWAVNTRAGFHIIEQGLGELSTNREFAAGRLLGEQCGTSFAAPHISYLCARLLTENPESGINLVRALLVSHAVIPVPCINLLPDTDTLRQICGYGQVDDRALLRSIENDVTLIAEDTLRDKRHHFYEVPVPDDFTTSGRRERELTVALAYLPPVRSTRIDYKASRTEFRLVTATDLDQVTQMFDRATPKDEYKSIPELSGASLGPTIRSKGTVQNATWCFKQFNARSKLRNQRLFVVVTRNDQPWGEGLTNIEEPYALAVCFRDRENERARLFTQLRNRLQERVRARV